MERTLHHERPTRLENTSDFVPDELCIVEREVLEDKRGEDGAHAPIGEREREAVRDQEGHVRDALSDARDLGRGPWWGQGARGPAWHGSNDPFTRIVDLSLLAGGSVALSRQEFELAYGAPHDAANLVGRLAGGTRHRVPCA
jgi:hypothetical protein